MIEKLDVKEDNMKTTDEEQHRENEIIDQERMNELIELDDPELIKELITIYFREGSQSLDEISLAIQNQQPKDLRAAAHKLKGGSASLGIKKVIKLSFEIEQLAERGIIEDTKPLFEKIKPVFEEAKEYLTKMYLS